MGIGNADVLMVLVAAGDSADTVGKAVKAAIAAQPGLPVSAAEAAGVVTITAKNKGTEGNAIRLLAACTAAGISTTVTAMAGGDANPDIQPALTAVIADGHDIIACGISDEANLLKLRAHLEKSARLPKNAGPLVCTATAAHWPPPPPWPANSTTVLCFAPGIAVRPACRANWRQLLHP